MRQYARPAGGFAGSGLLPHVVWVYGGHTLMLDQLVALQAVVYCLMWVCGGHTLMLDQLVALQAVVYCLMLCGCSGGHTLMLDQLVALQAVVYCLMLCGCVVVTH